MSESPMIFNGIDGATGSYVTPPLSADQVAALAQGAPIGKEQADDLESRHRRDSEATFGPIEGVDPGDMASSGWGVIFASNAPPAVMNALRPLLEHRREQAGRSKHDRYREYTRDKGYRVGDPKESKRAFLARNGAAAGMPADPSKVPYYLLLVGDPESIPYGFQSQLDVEYAVGRLWFETPDGTPDLDAFARYAQSVIAAEKGEVALARRAAFVGAQNDDDGATALSCEHLVSPLVALLGKERPAWAIDAAVGERARKAALAGLVNGPDVPALLFTASHGMGFPDGDPRQLPHQGALLCQDWPGPAKWRGRPIPPDHYLAADDVSDSARLAGMIAFHFACYGGGTPSLDDYPHLRQLSVQPRIAPRAFVAKLPQRLLGHPNGGALAVVGHVERAWSCSFHGGARLGEQLQAFQSTLLRLLDGLPIGWAMEYFNGLHAALGVELSQVLTDIRYGATPDNWALSSIWTANNDARSYLVLGDPAVRLSLAGTPAAARRPAAGFSVIPPTAGAPGVETRPASGSAGGTAAVETTSGPARASTEYEARVEAETITLTVPVRITIQVGSGGATRAEAEAFAAGAAAVSIDPEYGNREGYDPEFLGGGSLSVPLPALSDAQRSDATPVSGAEPDGDPYELKYHHFSLVMSRSRKLPFFTAVNIDGRSQSSPERSRDRWSFDPRVEREAQIGNEVYGRPFDRGHLVRRLDPAWGRSSGVVKTANDDTFHWTNCSPQHFRFNEGKNLWAGLEDYLLHKAGAERKRLTVFTGPVFETDDPEYRGVLIPKRYWKVAVLARDGALASLGFLVSQEALLRDFLSFGPEDVARTFQVPLLAVEKATGLALGAIKDLDAMSVTDFAPGEPLERELADFGDIRIPM